MQKADHDLIQHLRINHACVIFFMFLCVWSLYCNLVLIALSSVSIISLKLKELVVLLHFCIHCGASDYILLAVPWDYKKPSCVRVG